MKSIHHCPECKLFTFSPTCPHCAKSTESIRPLKYSQDDKYAHYRRQGLEERRKQRGLL